MFVSRAFRSLGRKPVYATAVVLMLTLGLATVGTMFALVHGVLLAPLPYGEPDRLVGVRLELASGDRLGQSPAVLAAVRRFSSQLEEIALYRVGSANIWTRDANAAAEHLTAAWISASLPRLLQVQPLLGRTFSEEEMRPGTPNAVVLSEAEWRSRFGSAPDVLGRTVMVNDVPREIIGVMPARFAFPAGSVRLWLPARSYSESTAGDFFYSAVARLAPDADRLAAERELSVVVPRLAELYPRLKSGGSTATWIAEVQPRLRLEPLHEVLTGRVAPTLWTLAAVAGLVLLAAFANVGSLALIRSESARHDDALRQALGASPLRAAAPLLRESLWLGLVAAGCALLVSSAAIHGLRAFGPADFPRLQELSLGPWSIGFTALVALACMLAVSLAPVWSRRGPALSSALHDASRGHSAGRASHRVRTATSVLQVAAALVVLAGSGLLLRSAAQLRDVHPGFEAGQVNSFGLLLPFARYDEQARVAFHAELTHRLGRLPGVQSAGLIARLPLGPGFSPEQSFRADPDGRTVMLPVNVAGNGYFAALRIPVLAGRDFHHLDGQRPSELILSQRAAMLLFGGPADADALGRTLSLEPGGPTYSVVGVVGDVRYDSLAAPPPAMVYRPQVVAAAPGVDPGPLPGMQLVVRSELPADALAAAVREIVHALDPGIPVFAIGSMQDVLRRSMAELSVMVRIVTAAAAATLVLGMIGLYGLMAYLVALRTREFGLRLALGADPGRIARGVLRRGLRLSGIGIALGAALFLIAAPGLRAWLFGVAAWDPLSLLGAALILLCTAALACWLPARRAAAVDPARALRAD